MANNYDTFTHISTATTTTVLDKQGLLKKVILNEPTSAIVTIYNNIVGSGDVIAIIAASTPAQTLEYDCVVGTGITVVTAGADDMTITSGI